MSWRERRARWHAARRRWRHSIRWRLVTLFVLLALATSALFLYGTQRMLKTGWQAWARPLVADYIDRLAADIGSPPDAARARALAAALPITIVIEGPQVQLDTRAAGARRAWPYWQHHTHDTREWGAVRTTADGHRITFGLAWLADAERPRRIGLYTLGGLLVLTLAAYAVVHRLLAPLASIGAGAARFGQGDFERPIALRRRDELGDLAERVNGMARGLQGMLDAKRALLLAISHELRSPLTRARLNAELVDDGAAKTALLRDLGEMRDLIAALLESERIAAGHRALQIERTDLGALVREVAASFAGAAIEVDIDAAVGAQDVDPVRTKLLLRNLIDNALRHAADAAAPPRVFLRREADARLALGVRDHGPGVPEAQRERLAEAFYRPDTARTRGSGGVGLGLYLCRLVAQAHGGELRLRDAAPGVEVAMVWPAPR